MAYSIPMNEGQQAEEYKRKKLDEKHNEENKYYNRISSTITNPKASYKETIDDEVNSDKLSDDGKKNHIEKMRQDRADSAKVFEKMNKTHKGYIDNKDRLRAEDSIARHNRRHPESKLETSIFESVELI